MIGAQHNKTVAKPFVKWAGGKGSLISQLIENLPQDFAEQPNVTYIEPFVGGGAMLWALDQFTWQSTFLMLAAFVFLNSLPILFF